MSPAVLERTQLPGFAETTPQMQARLAAARPGRTAEDPATLGDVIARAWEGLAAHRSAPCLLCGGAMIARYGAGGLPVGGRCTDCGTTVG